MVRPLPRPIRLGELIERFGGDLVGGSADTPIARIAPLATAVAGDLSFLSAARHRAEAAATGASAALVSAPLADALPAHVARVVVDDPYARFARVARWYEEELCAAQGEVEPAVAPSARIHPDARLGAGARIGPHAVVEAGARIGEDARIGAGCFVGRDASIGAGTRLHPNVTVYHECVLGARCVVHAGTVIGSDGFGFAREPQGWAKIPQLGAVRIGDDVEIGSNCSIDRGALEDTVIGDGCKLDNLVQVGHNVRIGEHTAIAGCVGIAGSAVIGRRCMLGGAAGVAGHLEICDDVVIGAATNVIRSIRRPGFYTGMFPLMPNADWERSAAVVKQLPALRERLRRLEGRAADRGPAPDASDPKDEDRP
jgi:UDP-3-O-[3-hydroxymyristoyl] glucosamine N-acyltransferase